MDDQASQTIECRLDGGQATMKENGEVAPPDETEWWLPLAIRVCFNNFL